MPSSRRQRELARQRAQRQAVRRAEKHKRRQRTIAIVAGLSVLVIAGVVALIIGLNSSSNKAGPATPVTTTPTPTPTTRPVACNGPVPPSSAPKTNPSPPPMTINANANYSMTMNTSCGTIVVALEAKQAPQTVNSLNFLAGQGYYNGTPCHRLVQSESLTVLQCGDPTGTGSGTPGYTLPEENLTGAKYTRGTMAMAKSSAPHSTGSQFFLVDKDSTLPPQYTVVGHINSPAGLAVLDKLMAAGQDNSNQTGDGAPLKRIYLNTVTVTQG